MCTLPPWPSGTDLTRLEPGQPSLRPLRARGQNPHTWAEGAADGATGAGDAAVTITVERFETRSLLRVAGELDGQTCSLLEAILEHLRADICGGRIELDLSDVAFADSQGLLPALAPDTSIKTASTAVRSTLRSLAREKAAPQ